MVSGRDPLGSFYVEAGRAYRSIRKEAWALFQATQPLQEKLAQNGLWLSLLPLPPQEEDAAYHCEVPLLPLILYPYEWPFSLWKEAALTTLVIQREALLQGFWLRDATPFNLTLYQGRMRHLDQLSLEPYPEGRPWPAYIEFVRGFLAPLLLMSYKDRRLGKLIQLYPEGLPLDLTWKLLPLKGKWSGLALIHLLPHKLKPSAKSPKGDIHIDRKKLIKLIDSMSFGIEKLKPLYASSAWEGYGDVACPYPPEARIKKESIVQTWIERLQIQWGLDIGAHEGGYTRLLASKSQEGVVALENDPLAIDRLWDTLGPLHKHLYPIWADFSEPSPALGWGQNIPSLIERLTERFDTVLALAIIHHLRYRNLIPYAAQLKLMAQLLKPQGYLIVEFIPIEDPQIRYLHSMPDIFPDHKQEAFENQLEKHFEVAGKEVLEPMKRVLYLLKRVK